MIKTLRVRLYPNENQKVLLEKHFGANRFIWNYFLQKRTEYYAESRKNGKPQGLNYFKTTKMLTELKKEKDWLYEISSQSLQQTLRKLDNAFTAFFRKNSDYPTFRSKKDNQYFIIPQYVEGSGNRLVIPMFKEGIRFRDKHQIPEPIDQIIITRQVNRYYASIYYESDDKPQKGDQKNGIDVGLKVFATLSDGIQVKNPRHLNSVEKRIKKQQQKLARKEKGSNNRKKQIIRIEKLYQELTDKRTDFLHKVSTAITKLSDTIVMESLNIQGMMQNHHLAKAIADVSWYRFKQMLQYKSEWNNIDFIEIGMWEASSRTCSRCGWINHELKLSDRMFICKSCGLEIDRDLNAAINIRNIGLIKVGLDRPEFTPVEIATSAELFNRRDLRDVGQ